MRDQRQTNPSDAIIDRASRPGNALFYQILRLRKLAFIGVHVPLRRREVGVAQQPASILNSLLPSTKLIDHFLKQPAEVVSRDRFHKAKIEARPHHQLPVLFVSETRDCDQDCLFAGDRLSKSLRQLEAVHLRHYEIGKNQLWVNLLHRLENVSP